MAAGHPLPFRRVEHVSSTTQGSCVIESQCAFCPFTAVSSNKKILAIAEGAHNCPGIHEFRTGKKPAQSVR